jgi:hypothetical protein
LVGLDTVVFGIASSSKCLDDGDNDERASQVPPSYYEKYDTKDTYTLNTYISGVRRLSEWLGYAGF